MLESLLPIIIILILIYIFVDYKKSEKKKAQEEARKIAIENKAKREQRAAENYEKKKKIYTQQLHSLYDHRSTKELMRIHSLLTTMHYNNYDFLDDRSTAESTDAFWSSCEELQKILNYPKWKCFYKNSFEQYYSKTPNPTWDMNYVYHLLSSRGVKF